MATLFEHQLSKIRGRLVTGNERQRDRRMLFETLEGERLWVDPTYLVELPVETKKVRNLMTGKEIEIPVDTPLCCDPSSETYWSM
jgi:hypothetical protein